MGKEAGGHAEKHKRGGEEREKERAKRDGNVQGWKGRGGRAASERHVYAKKEQESRPWKPDGIAFIVVVVVVCYRSPGFFGWE